MKWTVVWAPSAESHLMTLWTAGADRAAISYAADTIDYRLARDPQSCGQILFDTVRGFVVPPLAVEFEVFEDDRLVYVLKVKRVS